MGGVSLALCKMCSPAMRFCTMLLLLPLTAMPQPPYQFCGS